MTFRSGQTVWVMYMQRIVEAIILERKLKTAITVECACCGQLLGWKTKWFRTREAACRGKGKF